MRPLVSTEFISDIQSINNADSIEVATVKGWKVVVKKGEFTIGDSAFYFEVDSWVPRKLAPFLCKGDPKYFNGVDGALLKTIRLRGQVSQGLLLPLEYVNEYLSSNNPRDDGQSIEQRLGIVKYEPAETSIGNPFPYFLQKTDQERIQNLEDLTEFFGAYELTEKLDGSSMTIFTHNGEFGVCSRNIKLNANDRSHFTIVAEKCGILEQLKNFESLAIQGELIGPGIQGNPYKLKECQFFCYSIFDIKKQKYWLPEDRITFCEDFGIFHVPILPFPIGANSFYLDSGTTIESLLDISNGPSLLNSNVKREGLVFKSHFNQNSFKVISNEWLLKQ